MTVSIKKRFLLLKLQVSYLVWVIGIWVRFIPEKIKFLAQTIWLALKKLPICPIFHFRPPWQNQSLRNSFFIRHSYVSTTGKQLLASAWRLSRSKRRNLWFRRLLLRPGGPNSKMSRFGTKFTPKHIVWATNFVFGWKNPTPRRLGRPNMRPVVWATNIFSGKLSFWPFLR